MFSLVSRKFLAMRNIALYSVLTINHYTSDLKEIFIKNKFDEKKRIQKIFFVKNFPNNRVRWSFDAVFRLEKTAVDTIPLYRRTVLKEECLYTKLLQSKK